MRRGLIVITVFALAGVGGAQQGSGNTPLALSSPSLPPSSEQQLFKLLNLERQHAGVPLLVWDSHLADAAQTHAEKMARAGDISHRFAGESNLTERASDAGALFKSVAENVALANNPEEIHLALMNSPGHRANILNPQYNAVGIGAVEVKAELYVTEDFAQVVPAYSVDQFRQGVVAAFNQLRQARGVRAISAQGDARLDQAACSGRLDPGSVLTGQSGAASVTSFTAVQPWDLPSPMEKSAADSTLQRMSLGVCFRPDPANSFAQFWVVAVFFATRQSQGATPPLLPLTR
ncbi:MAG TPA: CAP domain-containing protein [Terriglobales bacterium]